MRYAAISAKQNTTGGFGNLQVSTYLNNIATPIEGAIVRVYDPQSNEIIAEEKTNDQGLIPELTLASPPIEFSMNYDQPRPFNQYNVIISYTDYPDINVFNVQIYPDTTAIQETVFIPVFEDIYIPYPVLWGDFPPKIPEAAIKRMPFPTNLVVLPQPVIPELVVVHAGVPDDRTAPNYTVTYKEYVKNVASSEIYSSWPQEALKANILAIQSFVLNRVFTEWYRGRGYNFTITNSTAYDQAFVFGRTIYQEVSDVVEELFTTYISKPDILQPLFTQYSDGRRVVRDGWLSQWGSKELADTGYDALAILKNYYGNEIILKQAEKVQGIPMSFPGEVLKIGSTGDAVTMLQQQLNAISNNYPLIPKVIVDGIYGESTANSVKVFQSVFNLPQTGEANFPTWYKLSDVYVAVQKLS